MLLGRLFLFWAADEFSMIFLAKNLMCIADDSAVLYHAGDRNNPVSKFIGFVLPFIPGTSDFEITFRDRNHEWLNQTAYADGKKEMTAEVERLHALVEHERSAGGNSEYVAELQRQLEERKSGLQLVEQQIGDMSTHLDTAVKQPENYVDLLGTPTQWLEKKSFTWNWTAHSHTLFTECF